MTRFIGPIGARKGILDHVNTPSLTRRLTYDAIMLALFCVLGMFSIPFGNGIKVSVQTLMLFILCFTAYGVGDCLLVTGCYLLLGLFMPVYAGFNSGISPTFGYIIAFLAASPVIHLIGRIKTLPPLLSMILACMVGMLLIYIIGTVYMMIYLGMDLGATLMVSVVPYLPFDALKCALAILTVLMIPKRFRMRK